MSTHTGHSAPSGTVCEERPLWAGLSGGGHQWAGLKVGRKRVGGPDRLWSSGRQEESSRKPGAAMSFRLGVLRFLLGVFFVLTGAAKLFQVSAPVSQQMVSGTRGRTVCARFPGASCLRARGRLGLPSSFLHIQVGGHGTSLLEEHVVPRPI